MDGGQGARSDVSGEQEEIICSNIASVYAVQQQDASEKQLFERLDPSRLLNVSN